MKYRMSNKYFPTNDYIVKVVVIALRIVTYTAYIL